MSYFDKKLNVCTSELSKIQRYNLPLFCYNHIVNFSFKYFKKTDCGNVAFPDQTYIPNKLKFSYHYRKAIIVKKSDITYRNFKLQTIIGNNVKNVTIHVAEGVARLNCQNKRRLNYVFWNFIQVIS